ncbi:uncharacterized protein C8R40DRAFT_1070777 [Lentinula edodes]|uniref:uncharacterized protein n=1 Tax=Lentinula edodes TaxID=5353 RepID=UPI001E8ED46C|nr:uncharacterized protein C8R40DRAFT_1070777 [Lentinula edodes]KAH7873550.1 hypothetical protein C8R40DRAFT_1070777 [Lentinula edodes]KAJ3920012.1 hypothetical protein F5877DRAFT_66101 [Lentinula edodes]
MKKTNSLRTAAAISKKGPPSIPLGPSPPMLLVNKAALAAAANPLRPTPAIPASPPIFVSGSGKGGLKGGPLRLGAGEYVVRGGPTILPEPDANGVLPGRRLFGNRGDIGAFGTGEPRFIGAPDPRIFAFIPGIDVDDEKDGLGSGPVKVEGADDEVVIDAIMVDVVAGLNDDDRGDKEDMTSSLRPDDMKDGLFVPTDDTVSLFLFPEVVEEFIVSLVVSLSSLEPDLAELELITEVAADLMLDTEGAPALCGPVLFLNGEVPGMLPLEEGPFWEK